MVYLANLSARDYIRKSNKFLPAINEYITSRGVGDLLIPMSCEFEQQVNKRLPVPLLCLSSSRS